MSRECLGSVASRSSSRDEFAYLGPTWLISGNLGGSRARGAAASQPAGKLSVTHPSEKRDTSTSSPKWSAAG